MWNGASVLLGKPRCGASTGRRRIIVGQVSDGKHQEHVWHSTIVVRGGQSMYVRLADGAELFYTIDDCTAP